MTAMVASSDLHAPGFTPTCTFAGYADGNRAMFHHYAEVMQVLLDHRIRMLDNTLEMPDDESYYTSDDDSEVDHAADEPESLLGPPPTPAQERMRHEIYANTQMELFISRIRAYADKPVLRSKSAGLLVMIYNGKIMEYTNALRKTRSDCKYWVHAIHKSMRPWADVTQGYSPIYQGVFEVLVGWNLGRLSPALGVIVAALKVMRGKVEGEKPKWEQDIEDRDGVEETKVESWLRSWQ